MAEKRKQEGHYQNKPKRFKASPGSGGSAGQAKQVNKNAKKHIPSVGAIRKRLKVATKWKKKQKYVFKTLSKQKESSPSETYKKIQDVVDGNKPDGNNLHSKDDFKKSKKKRRKRNKKAPKNDQMTEITSPMAASMKEKQVHGNTADPAVSDRDSNKSVGKAQKKKKRKGKKQTGDEKRKHGEEKDELVLPRKPEEISANWKAMLTKLQKSDPGKNQSRKQDLLDRRKGGHSKHKKGSSEIWFDDVDPELLRANEATSSVTKDTISQSEKVGDKFVTEGTDEGPTKCVALDCEMVGAGKDGKENLLARVSIVNQYGHCLYDKFVKAREDVTDYRTWVSGVRPKDLETAEDFLTVQKEVADLLKGRILVGHALQNDMKVLFLDHPKRMVRDTFRYEPFRQMFRSRRPGLKGLVEKILHVQFQKGEHNSVEDAQAVMKLYMLNRKQWEASLKMKPKKKGAT